MKKLFLLSTTLATMPLATLAVISCNAKGTNIVEDNVVKEKKYKCVITNAVSPVECLNAELFKKEKWGEWTKIDSFVFTTDKQYEEGAYDTWYLTKEKLKFKILKAFDVENTDEIIFKINVNKLK